METTTTVRVKKSTRERLKKLAAAGKVSITKLLEELVVRHEKSFWDGFNDEALHVLNKSEKKARKMFERVLKDEL